MSAESSREEEVAGQAVATGSPAPALALPLGTSRGSAGYRRTTSFAQEAKLLALLALPVAIARVSSLTMGLVDTWMVGKLGAKELAGVALADSCFFTVLVLALGIVRALDPMVSQAFGGGDALHCAASWRAGLRLALLLSLPLVAFLILVLGPSLYLFGQDAEVIGFARGYLVPIAFGVPAQLLYLANASLIQGLGDTRPPMVVAILANAVNLFLDYALIYGKFGFPELGVTGCGIASAGCQWFMCLALFAWVLGRRSYGPYTIRVAVPWRVLGGALRLGIPIGLAHSFEVGAFALASIFLGWIGPEAQAAHQIVLKMAATSFMVAVAIGVATSIRVGNGIGAGEGAGAQRSAWAGVSIGLAVMGVMALVYAGAGDAIVASFSDEPGVIAIGSALMLVAAAFQLSDGIQAVASGALRGAGDTIGPMLAQILAHWGVGIPCAYLLAFHLGWGPKGVWWGLALGLTLAAGLLLIPMARIRSRAALARDRAPESR